MHPRTHFPARRIIAPLIALALIGCSEDATGPSGPSVAGTWSGQWIDAPVSMTLQQRGSEVTGELRVGSRAYPVTGEMVNVASFVWSTAVDQDTCTGFSSSGLQVIDSGEGLQGVMIQARRATPCGSSTRTHVTQGQASMTRVSGG